MLSFIPLPYRILGITLLVAVVGGYIGYQRLQIADLKAANTDLVHETQLQKVALDELQRAAERVQAEIVAANVRTGEANDRFDAAMVQVDKLRKTFDNHDFANLLRRKPGLVTRRMKSATAKVFTEAEEVAAPP